MPDQADTQALMASALEKQLGRAIVRAEKAEAALAAALADPTEDEVEKVTRAIAALATHGWVTPIQARGVLSVFLSERREGR